MFFTLYALLFVVFDFRCRNHSNACDLITFVKILRFNARNCFAFFHSNIIHVKANDFALYESERWIQRSLEELSQNRTTITIAHRLSTIRDADEIIVITEDGIAERGTHEELLDMNGVYAAYYNM